MHAAFERLIQHLDERDLRYRADNNAGSICVDFRGDVGTYRVIAAVDEDGELFEVFGCAPVRVPAGARPSIAETIARANYGLRLGKLEMNYDDGEIRFQVAHVLTNGVLDDGIIARSFGAAMAMLDRYLPAILSVIYGNELPKDAVRIVEQPDVPEVD
jgi:hypothetical protein